MTRLLRCPKDREYTLREACPRCGTRTASPLPPRYSPEDRYGAYRRRLKDLVEAEGRPRAGGR